MTLNGDGELVTAYNTPVRERLIPMVAAALERCSLLGLELTGWDVVFVREGQVLACGLVIGIRGVDVAGPMKELVRFQGFDTWNPDQNQVDRLVNTVIEGLREFRNGLARQAMLDANKANGRPRGV